MADLGFTACAAWRWLPGMRTDTGIRIVAVGSDDNGPYIAGWLIGNSAVERYYTDPPLFAPDLADPATLGAIEQGILAPAGVWIECAAHHDGTPRWCARTEDGPVPTVGGGRWWRRTLAAALLDGLRAVTP